MTETAWQYIARIVSERNDDECWNWPFVTLHSGYGVLHAPRSIDPKHRHLLAHKQAFLLRFGHWPVPYGLHKCDNRRCFNPSHIFEGTLKDNTQDMMRKGRNKYILPPPRRGEDSNFAKLSESQVVEILRDYVPRKVSQYKLAERYRVKQSVISNIINRKVWKHIPSQAETL